MDCSGCGKRISGTFYEAPAGGRYCVKCAAELPFNPPTRGHQDPQLTQPISLPKAQEMPTTPGWAIASLILGILALSLSFHWIGGWLGLTGLILGVVHFQARKRPKGLAWWGISLSTLGIFASIYGAVSQSNLSALSLISGPILVVLMLCFYRMRRGQPLPPPLFPAIPLALTSVSIPVVAANLLIINTFEIKAKVADGATLAAGLTDSWLLLMWGVIEFGACIVVAAIFQIMTGEAAKEVKADGMAGSPLSMGPAAWSAAAALAVGILAWFFGDTVQLIAMVSDSARIPEARAHLGNMDVGAFSKLVSSRLVRLSLSAFFLTGVLIAVAIRCLKPGRVRRWDVAISGLLAIVLLGCCGASTVGMVREIQYLRTLVNDFLKGEPAYVKIPDGEFQMGCVNRNDDCQADEQPPPHKTKITNSFSLSHTEVTVEAYRRFVEDQKLTMPRPPDFNPAWGHPDHPIVNVTWDDAKRYCDWAGGRLPTEAEWEYAARGGKQGKKCPWGDEINQAHANYDSTGTTPVAKYPQNDWGLYDVSGNVWEWTKDWYDKDYYKTSPEADPPGPTQQTTYRVVRGGSWRDIDPWYLRCSVRVRLEPVNGSSYVGFRCVREVFP